MVRVILIMWVLTGCGEVNVRSDASVEELDASGDASMCGAAGQSCCSSDVCETGLACSSDQICRSAELWIGGYSSGGVAMIAHGNGETFSLDPIGTGVVTALWGTSADDVWVTGITGATAWARHWDGSTWAPEVDLVPSLYGIWGDAPNNYWALQSDGSAGSVLHWDGTAWSAPDVLAQGTFLTQIWGSGENDVWALGENTVAHRDGSGSWNVMTRSDFSVGSGISGWRASRMFAGGSQANKPAVLMWDGAQFSTAILGDGQDCASTRAVWVGEDDAWALTAALTDSPPCDPTPTIMQYEDGAWESNGKLAEAAGVRMMWGTSNRDVYVLGSTTSGSSALFHFDGTNWTTAYTTADTTMLAVWGTGQPR